MCLKFCDSVRGSASGPLNADAVIVDDPGSHHVVCFAITGSAPSVFADSWIQLVYRCGKLLGPL